MNVFCHVMMSGVVLCGFAGAAALAQRAVDLAPGATAATPVAPAQPADAGGGEPWIYASYKGLTTPRAYQPLPRMAVGPGGVSTAVRPPAVRVLPIADRLRREYGIDPFYTKHLAVGPIVILGSDRVSDWALLEAAYVMDHYLHDCPPWVHDALATNKVRLAVMAVVEYTMDLPENRRMKNGAYEDQRSRGLGGMPHCSCGEENVLNLRGDPYGGNGKQGSGENITIHEFAHALASAIGVQQGRKGEFWTKLNQAFKDAMAPGGRLEVFNRSRGAHRVYASANAQEYWAEGAQAWFDNANPDNSGGLSVRDDVKKKDPALAALLTEIFGDGTWRYIKTTARKPDGTPLRPKEDLEHLAGFAELRPQFPRFDFKNSPRVIAARKTTPATRSAGGSRAAQP